MINPDGLVTLRDSLERSQVNIFPLILNSSLWVSREAFDLLPLWYPEYKRKGDLYKSNWVDRLLNKGIPKQETNVMAANALKSALGLNDKYTDWSCCHVWGTDGFEDTNLIIQDSRYYSCVGNMIYLPVPLKAFTDSMPEIKFGLRVLAFHLYGWSCEHPQASKDNDLILQGKVPEFYPKDYPHPLKRVLPPNILLPTTKVINMIAKRKADIKSALQNEILLNYPREDVLKTLEFWKIKI